MIQRRPIIAVRRLGNDDAIDYRRLRLDALRLSPEAFGDSSDDDRVRPIGDFADAVERNAIFGACLDDGSLAGTVGMFVRSGKKLRHTAAMFGLFVSSDRRGEGIGRQLCVSVIARASELVEEVQLAVGTLERTGDSALSVTGLPRVRGRTPRALSRWPVHRRNAHGVGV